MEHDNVDSPIAAGTVRRNEVGRAPETRPTHEILPSLAGNAAFARLVRDSQVTGAFRLEADLSAVRVHTDSTAATLNRAVQAEAFTTGTDVFFAPGRFDPSSPTGRGLLAHELTHVVQQSARAAGPGGTVSHPDDPAELEAAAIGAQVARQATPIPDEEEEPVPAT